MKINKVLRHYSYGLTLAASLTAGTALAQVTANNLPTTVQPGNVEQQLPARQQEVSPQIELPQTPELKIPTGTANVRFTLKSLNVAGSTIYKPEQLSKLYSSLIGKDVSLADIYGVANAITAKYRADGYILSRVLVPTQDVTTGSVKLVAIEGYIHNVNFDYEKLANRKSTTSIEKTVKANIEAARPLSSAVLERNLLLLNDHAGITAKAVLKPSNVAQAADMDIVMSFHRMDGYVQIDNRGTRYIGPDEGIASVNLNDVFCDGGTIGLRGALSDDANELRFGEASYSRFLTDSGLKLTILGNYSRDEPGYTLTDFDVKGRADRLEGTLSYPLIRGRSQNLSVSGGFSYENVKTDVLGAELFDDKVRAFRFGANWDKADTYLGFNSAVAQLSQGADILDASQSGSGTLSRAGANPDFTKLSASASREQLIPHTNFSVAGTLGGQWSPDTLYASEQFGLGGTTFLSAFDPNEVLGDSGAAGRLEARYNEYWFGSENVNKYLKSVQYYAFYDAGFVYNHTPSGGQDSYNHLTDGGVGARLFLAYNLSGSVEVAKPLVGQVATEGDDNPRIFFRISKAF